MKYHRNACRLVVLLSLLHPLAAAAGPSQVGGRLSPDGKEEIALDLPGSEHMKNVPGRDGAGCCVFTSIEHAGRWANVEQLRGFQQKVAKNEPGGGWPSKLDRMLAKYAPQVEYVQYSGTDPSILRLALKTGRMPGVTYGYSPRYGGRIAHMVNLVHLSDRWAAVLDNNFPGENQYEWMSPGEFLYRWKLGDTQGWAVIPLAPPPPPIPVNQDAAPPKGQRVIGQWGNGSCAPVGTPDLTPRPVYRWHRFAHDPSQAALLKDGVQVGTYDFDGGYYRTYDARTKTWGQRGRPPVSPPPDERPGQRQAEAVPAEQNFGVRRDQIPAGETYAVNGHPVSPSAAHKAVTGGGSLSDDSDRWHLTLIGTPDECRRVADDVKAHPALAAWKDRLLVQAYRPDAWAVKGVNLPAGGRPTIVVQEAPGPNGKARVLHRQDDYEGGAAALAGALRRADPNYDPRRDTDLRQQPPPAPLANPEPAPPWWQPGSAPHWWAVLGAVAMWALQRWGPPWLRWLIGLWQAARQPAPSKPQTPDLDELLSRLLKKLEETKKPVA
jgi:hypothetical protein